MKIFRGFSLPFLLAALLFSCAGKPAPLPEPPAPPEVAVPEPAVAEPPAAAPEPAPAETVSAASGDSAAVAVEAQAEPPPEPPAPFALPGLGTNFAFAETEPLLRWNPQPADTRVQVQVSAREDFGALLFDGETDESFLRIGVKLQPARTYYLRARRAAREGEAEPWVSVVTISYRPLTVETRTIVEPGRTAVFVMGGDKGAARERPEHRVTLSRPYAMGVHEVTNALLAEVLNRMLASGEAVWENGNVVGRDKTPYVGIKSLNYGSQFGLEERNGRISPKRGRENHPAVGISRYGAAAVLNALSRMHGLAPVYREPPADDSGIDPEADGYRLPTEAEWEYAARGSRSLLFPGGGAAADPRRANFHRSGDPYETTRADPAARGGPTTPAGYYGGGRRGSFATASGASPSGLFDMLGNVWEWCEDFFDAEYYAVSPDKDPAGPDSGEFRSVRGGAWNTPRADISLASRGWYKPGGFSYSIGLRLARTLRPE